MELLSFEMKESASYRWVEEQGDIDMFPVNKVLFPSNNITGNSAKPVHVD